MPELSSEEIYDRLRKRAITVRNVKIIALTASIFALLILIFFDAKALVVSFFFAAALGLGVTVLIHSAGAKRKKASKNYQFDERFAKRHSNMPPPSAGYGRMSLANRPKAEERDKDKKEKYYQNPYSTAEGYAALYESYHSRSDSGGKGGGNGKGSGGGFGGSYRGSGQQSQLGSQVSNTAMIIFLIVAGLVIWLFG